MRIKYIWEKTDLKPGVAFKDGDQQYIIGAIPNATEVCVVNIGLQNSRVHDISRLLDLMNSTHGSMGAIPCEVGLTRSPV